MAALDIENLFQNHTVEEIKVVEKQLRSDVEKRKEEQRILVGERYRDLINAADAIKDMNDSTSQIFAGIGAIGDLCNEFSSQECIFNQTSTQSSEEHAFYSLATQMNLLVDTPEKIWCALDNHEYLLSCRYYLFSQHIVTTSLNVDNSESKQDQDLYASFPILHHQWAAISHFKPSILKGSLNSLKDTLLPDKVIGENVCVLTLLDHYSPRQVLTEFLLARKAALQEIFHGSLHSKSVKSQICDMVYLIQLTIQQIVSLFYADEKYPDATPLYYDILNKVVNNKQDDKSTVFEELFGNDLDVFFVNRYLPQTVLGFTPKLKVVAVSMTTSYIQSHVTEWIRQCLSDSSKGVPSLLAYVNNIKGLAVIRDAVYDLLSQTTDDNNMILDEYDEHTNRRTWEYDCHVTVNKKLNIWDEFLADHFLQRAKEVASQHLDTSFKTLENVLQNTFSSLEIQTDTNVWDRNLTNFIWHEFPQVHKMDMNDCKKEENMLFLKTNLCTPDIQMLCDTFDSLLERGLHDVQHFLAASSNVTVEDEQQKKLHSIQQDMRKFFHDQEDVGEAFQKFADAAKMKEYLLNEFYKKIEEFCGYIEKMLNSNDKEVTFLASMKSTFLSRLCANLPNLCVHIEKISNITQHHVVNKHNLQKTSHKQQRLGKPKSSEVYSNIKQMLRETSNRGFEIWCNSTRAACEKTIKKIFEDDSALLLLSITNRECVSIEEESETGKTVDSTITVPAQISFYLSSLLYHISEELFRLGMQSADRSMISSMMSQIISTILKCHVERLQNKDNLYQNRILQMLFDVKFLYKFCVASQDVPEASKDNVVSIATSLIRQLEEYIDPFDLDVFTPHIENFIKRQLLRCTLLFGGLSRIDKHSIHVSKGLGSFDEQHSAVPMVSNPPRYMLLPLSSNNDEEMCQVNFDDENEDWLVDRSHVRISI